MSWKDIEFKVFIFYLKDSRLVSSKCFWFKIKKSSVKSISV